MRPIKLFIPACLLIIHHVLAAPIADTLVEAIRTALQPRIVTGPGTGPFTPFSAGPDGGAGVVHPTTGDLPTSIDQLTGVNSTHPGGLDIPLAANPIEPDDSSDAEDSDAADQGSDRPPERQLSNGPQVIAHGNLGLNPTRYASGGIWLIAGVQYIFTATAPFTAMIFDGTWAHGDLMQGIHITMSAQNPGQQYTFTVTTTQMYNVGYLDWQQALSWTLATLWQSVIPQNPGG